MRRRTDAEVRVDTGVPSSAGQVLVLAVGNMQMSPGIAILFSQPEINNMDLIALPTYTIKTP